MTCGVHGSSVHNAECWDGCYVFPLFVFAQLWATTWSASDIVVDTGFLDRDPSVLENSYVVSYLCLAWTFAMSLPSSKIVHENFAIELSTGEIILRASNGIMRSSLLHKYQPGPSESQYVLRFWVPFGSCNGEQSRRSRARITFCQQYSTSYFSSHKFAKQEAESLWPPRYLYRYSFS